MKSYLSHPGTFKVLAQGDFPLEKRVGEGVHHLGRGGRVPQTGEDRVVDVGVEKFLVTSEGEYLPNLGPYERGLAREVAQDPVQEFLWRNRFKKVKLAEAHGRLRNLGTPHEAWEALGGEIRGDGGRSR